MIDEQNAMTPPASVLEKLRRTFAQRGLVGGASYLRSKAGERLKRYSLSRISWWRARAKRDAEFDRRHRVDTGGSRKIVTLTVAGQNNSLGTDYLGVEVNEFNRGITQLRIRHEDFVFIDLGSGKGRALMLASDFPFRKIIGVEFAQELHGIAESNLARYTSPTQRCSNFELHCVDAATYEFPEEDQVVFLYNPFREELMDRVAARAHAAWLRHRKRIFVVYLNPVQTQSWIRHEFKVVAKGDLYAIFAPMADASSWIGPK
jgi:hypothetical protein